MASKRPSRFGLRTARIDYRIPQKLKTKFLLCVPESMNATEVTELLYYGFITGLIKLEVIKL